MRVKIFTFYDDMSVEGLENMIQKFLGRGVRVRHVAQSSVVFGGSHTQTIITIFYEKTST